MMLRINKIEIENFRGVRSKINLDFKKGGNFTSVLIYGRNGTGKSSILDCWDWLLNSKIDYLAKEGVSERDYPHKLSNGNDVYINIDFTHDQINNIKCEFNPSKVTTPIRTGKFEEFRKYSIYPNYLRYADLQEFVYKSKGEKYKYIAKFFGLERFTKNQSDIQASLTRISSQLSQFSLQISESKNIISTLVGKADFEQTDLVHYFNKIAEKYNLNSISNLKNHEQIITELSKLVHDNPTTRELALFQTFQAKINSFYPFPTILKDCILLESLFADLKQNESDITNLVLLDLYNVTNQTLQKIDNKNICPVCDNTFLGSLGDHVLQKHNLLAGIRTKREKYITQRDLLIKKIESIQQKIFSIQSGNGEIVSTLFLNVFNELNAIQQELPETLRILRQELRDTETINFSILPSTLKIEGIVSQELTYKEFVSKRIQELSADEKSKDLANDYRNITKLVDAYSRYLRCEKKITYLSNITSHLQTLFSLLTEFIQQSIQNTFDVIQTDLIECYNFIEDSNPFLKNPKITLVTGKDKAIELEIDFVNEKITPAYKFMSESQINSFGFAIFLSATKHFNLNFKFILLDDIVNSFDAFKRPKVAQLIAKKFNDFQILFLTHDQVFFDTMQKHFPSWNRYKFASWDYNTGPRCFFSKNYNEEIQNLLDHDEANTAGQKLGRYLEMTFGILNENLQTPLRYKLENTYTLSEFYEPLVKRFKDKLKLSGKTSKVSVLINEFDQGTIFRNYCAHWKDESSPFTSIEIQNIFNKWLEIENEIYCESCRSYCSIERKDAFEYIRCNCGNLNLKDESRFI